MGEVFLAHDTHLDRPVAIKVIRRDRLADPQFRARFLREAHAASSLVDPFVATVFDVVEAGDDIYLVLEYIEGRRLDEVIAENALSFPERLRIAAELADALEAVHRHGLVHRDVKPGNVMLTTYGHIKLLDFGLARPVHVRPLVADVSDAPTETAGLTRPGVTAGTTQYMSPEQLRGEELTPASDIFSFGIVLHELLFKSHPFWRPSIAEIAAAILGDPPAVARATAAGAPAESPFVVERALAKAPAARYSSAAELAADLRRLERGERTSAASALSRAALRRRALLAALGMLPVLAGGGIAWRALARPPTWDRPRFAVAFAPLVDRTGDRDGPLRAAMIADLACTDLGASRFVRAVGPGDLAPVLEAMPAGAAPEETGRRLASSFTVDFVVTGTLYREGSRYIAALQAIPAAGRPRLPALRVNARTPSGVAEDLASALRRVLPGVSALNAWRDARTDLDELVTASEQAQLLHQAGVGALRVGKIGEAIEHLERAVAADPRFASAHAALATALKSAGYARRARDAAARAMALAPPPDSPATERLALMLKATWASVFDRPDEALAATGTLAAQQPDDPYAIARHAAALSRASRLPEAEAAFRRALAIERADPSLHLQLADVLIQAQSIDKARQALDDAERLFKAAGSDEGLALVQRHRGNIALLSEDYAAAERQFGGAAELFDAASRDALAAGSRLDAAAIDVQLGKPALADERLVQAESAARRVGDEDLLASVLCRRGAQRFLEGRYTEAESLLRDATDIARRLQNDALLLEPLLNLGGLLSYTGRTEEAERTLDELSKLARSFGRRDLELTARLTLASVRGQRGEIREALASYDEALRDAGTPDQALEAGWAHLGRAELLEGQGRLAAALEAADRAFEVFEAARMPVHQGYARARRAQVLARLGRTSGARAALAEARRAADSTPGQSDLQVRCALARAVILAAENRWADSRSEAERALQLPAATAPDLSSAGLTIICESRLGSRELHRAVTDCSRAVSAPRVSALERAAARAALAEALLAAGDAPLARETARTLFDEATKMDLLLPTARATAVLLTTDAEMGDAATESIRRRGREALEAHIAAAPEADRPALRGRSLERRLDKALSK